MKKKRGKKAQEGYQTEGPKKIWQMKAMGNSGFPFATKNIIETIEDINKTHRLDNSIVKVWVSRIP